VLTEPCTTAPAVQRSTTIIDQWLTRAISEHGEVDPVEPAPVDGAETSHGIDLDLSDDDDADFAAMDKRTAARTPSAKRKRSESLDPDAAIAVKPRKPRATAKEPRDRSTSARLARAKLMETVHPDFPTIVSNESGQWVELRCHICGVNKNPSNKHLFKGRLGMLYHYIAAHKDRLGEGERYHMLEVIAKASCHVLSDQEVESIKAGITDEYKVPLVDSEWKVARAANEVKPKDSS